jgi:3-hydroxybutyryl-CoA dehydrogenase
MVYTLPEDVEQRPVAINGAGTLGRRIATVYAAAGSEVRVFDLSEEQRAAARDHVAGHLAQTAQTLGRSTERPGRVETPDDLAAAVAGAWMVIESVPEHVELKTAVFGELDRLARATTVATADLSETS